MSKRFGRNQRRRAREELAASQALVREHSRTAGLLSASWANERRRVEQLEQQLANAKLVIGRNHPAFPAARLDLGYMPHPDDYFQARTGPRDIATMAMMSVSADRDTFRNEVHFHLVHGVHRACYAISTVAMRRAVRSEEETRHLCQLITEELVEHTIEAFRSIDTRGHHGR